MEVMTHASTFLHPSLPASPGDRPSPCTYALVVLNQSLPSFAPLLWKHAQLRVCADGGANRVHDEMPLMFPHEDPFHVRKRYKPDVIKGDMDSIREEVKQFYSNLGTRIVDEAHDQDTTDLHKCVVFIRDCTPDLDKSNVKFHDISSCAYLLRAHLVVDLIMKLEISIFFIYSQESRSFSCLTIA